MRTLLLALPLVIGLTGCGDVYYQTRYIPTSIDDAYSPAEQVAWTGDKEAYELPANPPAIDDLHRSRRDCARPGQKFKATPVVGLTDVSPSSHGPRDPAIVGGMENGPQPGNALRPDKDYPVYAWREEPGQGAREHIGEVPVAGSDRGPFPFRGSGTNTTVNGLQVGAYRNDQTNWCDNRDIDQR